MAETQLTLCNQALTLIGAGPVSTLSGLDARAVAGTQLYQPIVDDIMGLHRWRFASTAALLTYIAASTTTPWESKFQMPTGVLMIHGVLDAYDNPVEFDRFDDQIHCDALSTDSIYLAYTRSVAETYWPVYFTSCVRLKLAAAFALAVAQNDQMANVYEGKFIRQVAAARLADSQGHTAYKLPVGGFAAVVQGRP